MRPLPKVSQPPQTSFKPNPFGVQLKSVSRSSQNPKPDFSEAKNNSTGKIVQIKRNPEPACVQQDTRNIKVISEICPGNMTASVSKPKSLSKVTTLKRSSSSTRSSEQENGIRPSLSVSRDAEGQKSKKRDKSPLVKAETEVADTTQLQKPSSLPHVEKLMESKCYGKLNTNKEAAEANLMPPSAAKIEGTQPKIQQNESGARYLASDSSSSDCGKNVGKKKRESSPVTKTFTETLQRLRRPQSKEPPVYSNSSVSRRENTPTRTSSFLPKSGDQLTKKREPSPIAKSYADKYDELVDRQVESLRTVRDKRSQSGENKVISIRRSPSVPRNSNSRAPSSERFTSRSTSLSRNIKGSSLSRQESLKSEKSTGKNVLHERCFETSVNKSNSVGLENGNLKPRIKATGSSKNEASEKIDNKKGKNKDDSKRLLSKETVNCDSNVIKEGETLLQTEPNISLAKDDILLIDDLISQPLSFSTKNEKCNQIDSKAFNNFVLTNENSDLNPMVAEKCEKETLTVAADPLCSDAEPSKNLIDVKASESSSPILIKNKLSSLASTSNETKIDAPKYAESTEGQTGTFSLRNDSFDCTHENCSEIITPITSSNSRTSFSSIDSGIDTRKHILENNLCKPSTSYESKTEEVKRKINQINKSILKKSISDETGCYPSLSLALSAFPTSEFCSESLSQSMRARMSKDIRSKSVAPTHENESVVINAGMSFLMGSRKRPVGVKHHFSTAPAHKLDKTVSAKLTKSVKEFLSRTDHVMEEWKQVGNYKPRSKSVTAFGETFYDPEDDESEEWAKSERRFSWKAWKKQRSGSSEEFKSAAEDGGSEVLSEDEVSELTNDLAEEHSTAVLATERLEAETTERLKLEKDVKELQEKLNSITSDHDRLELEVLCSRSTSQYLAASVTSEDFDPEADAAIYKQKYERCCRDLEFMKEKLRAQHEDDLDQMVSIKKQLEKKLNDAYEEVEEQRQVAAQWKRKAQRLVQEGNDTKLLLEEQVNRNAILEKKQRKFDSDMQNYQEEIRQEKSVKEKMQKERDFAILEKEQIEHDLQSVQLELEMRGERLSALQREVESLSADEKSDPEVASLRRSKLELENKVKDQEEELDDLAGQVQLLESAKVRLELQIENMRKDYKRELTSKDDEVEDVRCSAQKKVKAIEAQLEAEHEERTGLVREKHELERRLLELTSELSQSTNDVVLHKLKKELRKLKALLKDAQVQLEQAKSDTPSKVLLRQLRNQLEDAEFAKTTAIKGRQHAEQELQEMQLQYDEVSKLRNDAEDKYLQASRERTNLQTQLDDLDAEMTEIMRKYKSAVQQLSIDQLTIQEQASQIQFLEQEKQSLKESLAELSVKLENMEGETVTTHTQKRLELKIRELESKADLELTSKQRIETQVARLKETIEKSVVELENSRSKEQASQDQVRKLQRQLRELREELSGVNQRDTDASQKVREIEQAMDILEAENEALKRDLNIALRRIDDLQSAMQGDSESHESDAQLSDSDSDDSLGTVDTPLCRRRPLTARLPSTSRRSQSRTPSPVAL